MLAPHPADQPAIARFRGLGNWLISEFRVSSFDRARDAVDFVTATTLPENSEQPKGRSYSSKRTTKVDGLATLLESGEPNSL
jgi:hypothetical protein